MVPRWPSFIAASAYYFAHHLIHFFSAAYRQAKKNFCAFLSIADFLLSESPEEFFYQEHCKDILPHNHASSILICKFRIKFKPELGKKINCLVNILHWQVYKNLLYHDC